eukprot:TRINITY_DN4219_c0_g2_i1.p1 TRINITY_DN4219_c0_g2~~TRINITY_DN4219_c0_g2_i1.p1  ORF type:complete len:226 (-),score=26.33 TRINITY_DN4219_c0_g2_i1:59-736(-)
MTNLLRLLTFNILAPCYHHTDLTGLESRSKDLYIPRNKKIIDFLLASEVDIICLQEFWFEGELKNLYTTSLSSKYPQSVFLRRSGRKKDGCAIFFTPRISVTEVIEGGIIQDDIGDRVASLVECEIDGKRFLLTNAHLTFPHNHYDENILRLDQITQVCQGIDLFKQKHEKKTQFEIVCGDFNCPYKRRDCVSEYLESQGYYSSYKKVHGRDPDDLLFLLRYTLQ